MVLRQHGATSFSWFDVGGEPRSHWATGPTFRDHVRDPSGSPFEGPEVQGGKEDVEGKIQRAQVKKMDELNEEGDNFTSSTPRAGARWRK